MEAPTSSQENQFEKILNIRKVIYGVDVLKLTRSSKANSRRLYLSEVDKTTINWISPKKSINNSALNLKTVHKIEPGGTSEKFLKYLNPFNKSLAVSLFYKGGSLDIIFQDYKEMQMWVSGIQHLLTDSAGQNSTIISHKAWESADQDNSGNLNIEEVKKLMKGLNIHINENNIQLLFNEFDLNKNGLIDKKEFENLVNKLMEKPEIEEIFLHYSNGKPFMLYEDFKDFIEISQKEKNSAVLFKEICSSEKVDLSAFTSFVLSPKLNSIVSAKEENVHLDMSQPLSHYFIASSHNTYLQGNQLTGKSSIDQYTKVLLEGCRCVEIDSWDGEDGEPVVTHGHTLVNKIPLRSVAAEILKSGFVTSPYPIIISLENHCSYEQTGLIGEIFLSVFKTSIYSPSRHLLIPEDLKFKVLIKSKAPDHHASEAIHKNLTDLTGLPGVQFKLNLASNSVVSISESKLNKVISQHSPFKIIGFTQKTFMRIYPKATRINSSNYNPVLGWSHGAQIVAINYQKDDLGKLLNFALFQLNGRTGYVLKPECLRISNRTVDYLSPRFKKPKLRVFIEVISAFNLPKDRGSSEIPCPCVEVKSFGIEGDCFEHSTRVVERNGFNPVWKEEFCFDLMFPDVCFFVFTVLNKKDVLGRNAVFVKGMGSGFRVVKMLNGKLEEISGCLVLVKVNVSAGFGCRSERIVGSRI